MIKVFGHKAPDTDTTGSAILWAWFLNNHTSQKAEAFVLGRLNKETNFILNHWKLAEPELLENLNENDDVVIVDTNNDQELPNNISECNILQIIDHHRLAGGLSTKSPLEITIKPVACTATIIYDLIGESIVKDMPENMKGLMMSCILSDTLAFRSPTTTPHDRDVVEKLAKELGVDVDDYADKMFAAKSDLSDVGDNHVVLMDSKKVSVGDKNLRVSVIETTVPEEIIARKDNLVKTISEIKESEDLDDILFFVIDIFKEEATVFIQNDFVKSIIEESFDVSVESDIEVLSGIVSRKKQIIPALRLPN